jgi:hypothetical protein
LELDRVAARFPDETQASKLKQMPMLVRFNPRRLERILHKAKQSSHFQRR